MAANGCIYIVPISDSPDSNQQYIGLAAVLYVDGD